MIKALIDKNRSFLLLLLVFIASEIIVNPIGNFPLNDDWTYGKSELFLHNTGKIDIGDFPAMTLWTHLAWGELFTRIFGFSFTVLRFSTFISVIISLFFLNRLIMRITGNKITAFILCLALLFNPIYFNLSNTYMTDVSFNTLLVLCCYFAYDFFTNQKNIISFILVFIFSMLLVLIRQFGIIVPLCFAAACVFVKEKKWLYILLAVGFNIAVFVTFKFYENYLKSILDAGSAYKFSGNVSITQRIFWENLLINFKKRSVAVLLHVLFYTLPFVIIFGKSLLKNTKAVTLLIVSLASAVVVYYVFKDEPFPMGNILSNTSNGAETFFENLHPDYNSWPGHTYSKSMETWMTVIKYCFIYITVVCTVLFLLKLLRSQKIMASATGTFQQQPMLAFLMLLFAAYAFLLFIPDSFFDRYNLPLITVALIFLAFANKQYHASYKLAILPLLLFFYVSVFGTKDYLELNRKRWEAYYFLKDVKHVGYDKINGGFEMTCWHGGKKAVWQYFYDHKAYDYMIQYRQEDGFRMIREYEFQRYFPYKKDKIYIFANEHKTK